MIDTTLPASNPLRFGFFFFVLIKMTVADQLKVIDKKIESNQTQDDLG